jgi:hypothetical protein
MALLAPTERPATVNFRPLALPVEHGGWGILLEPLALAMLVAPSRAGALVAVAAFFGFLARHPLKLAMQDLVRGHSFARTMWCWIFAAWYAVLATYSLAFAISQSSARIMPFAVVAPLAIVMMVQEARRRGRSLVPEIAGAIAMSSTAAAIGIAAGLSYAAAFTLMALIAMRSVPTIVYVHTLLGRANATIALVLHALALGFGVYVGTPGAIAAYAALFSRAVWGLTHKAPRAKVIGWREIAWGVVTIALLALTPPILR